MKTINLKGGLGNQMFQYAYGRSLELSGRKIIFNTSFFSGDKSETDSARDYKLNNLNIKTRADFSNKKYPLCDFINKILVKLHLKENFWQNEKYFKNIESDIRDEFTLKKPLDNRFANVIKQIENTPSVSMHLRRGDYVDDKKTKAVHDVCDLEYYNRAIDIILAQVNSPTFFIFSDDIDWAEDNLKVPHPAFWVSNLEGKDHEELLLMSKCKHNIIANSTFSWWAAWLNQNPNKIVVAPKQWFVDKTSEEVDILPQKWIKI